MNAWAALANHAMQSEMLEVDQAEYDEWMDTMRALVTEGLDYVTFTARRTEALKDRTDARLQHLLGSLLLRAQRTGD